MYEPGYLKVHVLNLTGLVLIILIYACQQWLMF